jgi:hypothetical protein
MQNISRLTAANFVKPKVLRCDCDFASLRCYFFAAVVTSPGGTVRETGVEDFASSGKILEAASDLFCWRHAIIKMAE